MQFIIDKFFRKKKSKISHEKLNPATAKSVLLFLSHGLTYGAVSLSQRYSPKSKVNEFVAVSGSILNGLKQRRQTLPLADSVVVSVHINDAMKSIELKQVGEHVMLVLDDNSTIISLTTLDQIYISLRDDMVNHGDIYGSALQAAAASN